MFTRLDGSLRPYAWGRPGGVSEVLGRTLTAEGPEAEHWYATDELLLKVLAAAETLSLQVHPSHELAAEGFAREEEAGIPGDAAHRSYRDTGAKTELILALSDRFEALSGFRPAAEAGDRLRRLAAAAGPSAVEAAAGLLPMLADDATIGDAFLWLVSAAGRPFVDAVLPAIEARAADFPLQAWLAGLHPGDAGVVASLLLNHVVLRRGEVLASQTGDVHAYLVGTGIELMVNSDNVLRGGLTAKHVDLPELDRALRRPASSPQLVEPIALAEGMLEFAVPAVPEAIRLVVIRGLAEVPLSRDALVLCVSGVFTLDGGGEELSLTRGEAARISGLGEVAIAGEGELFLAR